MNKDIAKGAVVTEYDENGASELIDECSECAV